MNGQPTSGRGVRARVAAIAVCSALIAAGGLLTGTPASATACTTPVSLSGLVDSLHIPGDGLLTCTTTEQPPTEAMPATTPTPTASADPSSTVTDAAAGSTGSAISAQSAQSPVLADLTVLRGSTEVFPVRDGYLDTVKFAVRPSNAVGAGVAVVGTAEIVRGATVVKSWNIGSSDAVETWNGRVGGEIVPGLYSFRVTAWSPDGTTRTSSTYIRVMAQHLVKQSLVIRKRVGGGIVADSIPKQLLKAYSMGQVSVRTRTVATVHGTAHLVFTGPGGTHRIPLENGVHTTAATFVPQGFAKVTISHDWAKGVATLHSLTSIWSYYKLV